MSELLVMREKLQKFYADQSLFINKTLQFILAFVSFYLINDNIGLMKAATTPIMGLALAVICTFLPPVFTALAAAALVLLHLFSLSLGVMGATALIFLMMFIFYGRFTPGRAVVLLIMPIAHMLHIPYVVPVACGFAMAPTAAIPIAFGTIVYYMIQCVKESAAIISGTDGIVGQISLYIKMVFQNKELWVTVAAFVICTLAVYAVRRMSMDYAWKFAAAVGAIVNILVTVAGDFVFDIHISYGILIGGNCIAILVGMILEFFLFSVDYSRTEHIQYEDDEYYYYVKAVPKLAISAPKKTVKRINERKKSTENTKDSQHKTVRKTRTDGNSSGRRPPVRSGETRVLGNTDELLLAKSLQDELDIQNILKKELGDK